MAEPRRNQETERPSASKRGCHENSVSQQFFANDEKNQVMSALNERKRFAMEKNIRDAPGKHRKSELAISYGYYPNWTRIWNAEQKLLLHCALPSTNYDDALKQKDGSGPINKVETNKNFLEIGWRIHYAKFGEDQLFKWSELLSIQTARECMPKQMKWSVQQKEENSIAWSSIGGSWLWYWNKKIVPADRCKDRWWISFRANQCHRRHIKY